MMKLGEILVAGGQISPDDLQEALDWQVLYGGRLGTNLLELRLVEEEALARALGKQLGAEVAWGDFEVDPTLISAIPKHVADRHEMVPWKIERRRVKVLCTEIKVGELDQLGYRVGRTCVPVIAPEFRVFQLLRAHFGAQRQMRALDFGVVPEEGRTRRKRESKPQAPVEPPPELIDENAFNDLYAQVLQGKTGDARRQTMEQMQPAPTWQAQPAPPQGPPVMAPTAPPPAAAAPPPAAAPPSPVAPPAPVVEETLEALPEDAILEELPADAIEGAAPQLTGWDEPPPQAAPARDETPLDFKAALKALEGVSDRDSIAHIVLRASRSKAARALLLQVQGGVAIGWDGLGEGLENGAARNVALPLATDSAFSLVVKSRSHYMGPLQKTPLNIRFLAMLGKKVPLSALIFPILHRGRVSHMLYLDNGHRQQAPTDVGEMIILSQRIGQTVEALVERKRKAAAG